MPLVVRWLLMVLLLVSPTLAQPEAGGAGPATVVEPPGPVNGLAALREAIEQEELTEAELPARLEALEALRQRLLERREDLLESLQPDAAALEALDRRLTEVRSLLAELPEEVRRLALRRRLETVAAAVERADGHIGALNELVTRVTALRGEINAQITALETQLTEVNRALGVLLPDVAGQPAEAAAEAAAEPSADDAAKVLDAVAAAPGTPAVEVPDATIEAALAGLSPQVQQEARDLLAQRRRLRAWLGDYRLLLLRAERLLAELQSAVQETARAALLEQDASILGVVRANLERPGLWAVFGRQVIAGSVVDRALSHPGWLVVSVVLLAGLFTLGWRLRAQLEARAARQPQEAFGNQLWTAFLASAARHAPWVFALSGAAAYSSVLDMVVEPTPFVTLLAYALLAFLVARVISRSLLAPYPPARPLTSFPLGFERVFGRRVNILILLGVLGLLLLGVRGVYELPGPPYLLLRAVYVVLLAVNLAWLLWLVGRIPRVARFSRTVRVVTLVLLLGALVAELAGYRNLSTYILRGVLGTLLFSPLLWVVARLVGEFFERLWLQPHPLTRAVRTGLDLAPDAALPGTGWLRFSMSVVLWVASGLLLLRVWATDAGYAAAIAALDRGFELGALSIVPSNVIAALLLFGLLMVATAWGVALLQRVLKGNHRLDPGARDAILTLARYFGVVIAVFAGLNAIDVDFTTLAVVAGALSVGIGFGLQNIVSNFVAGLILLFERPIRAGDWVKVGNTEGIVTRVAVRYTEIKAFNKSDVVVPNSDMLSQHVINNTRHDPAGRVEIYVGVAYGSDTDLVRDLLLEAAREHPLVDRVGPPEPFVIFRGFGESALNLELYCIVTDVTQRLMVMSELNFAIDRKFRAHGVEVPFPQRDVHVVSSPSGESGMNAMAGAEADAEAPASQGEE